MKLLHPLRVRRATDADVDELASWFPDRLSCDRWSGPNFRYPFTPASFREDLLWTERASYAMVDANGTLAGFGQLYERFACVNLARLAVGPEYRGQGIGKELVRLLMIEGRKLFTLDHYSLFVYRDNVRAFRCYRSMGFAIQPYPQGELLADRCYYMTRPVIPGEQYAS